MKHDNSIFHISNSIDLIPDFQADLSIDINNPQEKKICLLPFLIYLTINKDLQAKFREGLELEININNEEVLAKSNVNRLDEYKPYFDEMEKLRFLEILLEVQPDLFKLYVLTSGCDKFLKGCKLVHMSEVQECLTRLRDANQRAKVIGKLDRIVGYLITYQPKDVFSPKTFKEVKKEVENHYHNSLKTRHVVQKNPTWTTEPHYVARVRITKAISAWKDTYKQKHCPAHIGFTSDYKPSSNSYDLTFEIQTFQSSHLLEFLASTLDKFHNEKQEFTEEFLSRPWEENRPKGRTPHPEQKKQYHTGHIPNHNHKKTYSPHQQNNRNSHNKNFPAQYEKEIRPKRDPQEKTAQVAMELIKCEGDLNVSKEAAEIAKSFMLQVIQKRLDGVFNREVLAKSYYPRNNKATLEIQVAASASRATKDKVIDEVMSLVTTLEEYNTNMSLSEVDKILKSKFGEPFEQYYERKPVAIIKKDPTVIVVGLGEDFKQFRKYVFTDDKNNKLFYSVNNDAVFTILCNSRRFDLYKIEEKYNANIRISESRKRISVRPGEKVKEVTDAITTLISEIEAQVKNSSMRTIVEYVPKAKPQVSENPRTRYLVSIRKYSSN